MITTAKNINQNKTTTMNTGKGRLIQNKCNCGSASKFSGQYYQCEKNTLYGVQPKLNIGAVNDVYEQEADRVADQVMARFADPCIGSAPMKIQRFTSQSNNLHETVLTSVDSRALSGSGKALQPSLRQDMEQRFGHDFSKVRIHSSSAAEQSARLINAQAYTAGNNIVFGAGQYSPETNWGRHLLAHELTHVVQQNNSASVTNTLQRKGGTFGGFFRNIGRAIVDFFTGSEPDYDDDTLNNYLKLLKETKEIEGDFDSDNKARAVVVKQPRFKLQLQTQIKVLLVEEMLDGVTGGDDEKAIIGLLRTSSRDESKRIVENIGRQRLWDNFSGKNRREIEAISLTKADFLNNSLIERLKSLSPGKLEDYQNNARDPDVKAAILKIQHLQKITTPIDFSVNFDKVGVASFELSGADIIVKPDVVSSDRQMGKNAHTSIVVGASETKPIMSPDGATVVSFTGGKTEIKMQTVYGPDVVLTSPSGYGRGTTSADKTSGNTSIKFHESQHGKDILNFIANNPPPTFKGKAGMSAADFVAAENTYQQELIDYHEKVFQFSIKQTDCVGTPIPSSGLREVGLPATFCTDTSKP